MARLTESDTRLRLTLVKQPNQYPSEVDRHTEHNLLRHIQGKQLNPYHSWIARTTDSDYCLRLTQDNKQYLSLVAKQTNHRQVAHRAQMRPSAARLTVAVAATPLQRTRDKQLNQYLSLAAEQT